MPILLIACTDVSEDVWIRHTIDDEFSGADGFDLSDVDQDGDMDAVVVWEESGLVIAYENPGVGGVTESWAKVDVSGGLDLQNVEDVKFADLDGDGRVDAVISATEIHSFKLGVHLLDDVQNWRSASAWHGTWTDPQHKHGYLKVAIGQLDGMDGNDIVAGTKHKRVDGVLYEGKLLWFPSPGTLVQPSGDLWVGHPIADIGWINNLQLIDLDADGDNDVLLSDRGNGLRWFENRLSTQASWIEHEIGVNHGDFVLCRGVAEREDVGIVAFVGGHPVFYSPTAEGGWHRQDIVSVNSLSKGQEWLGLKGIACGDVDMNGSTDIVISISGHGHGVFAYLQDEGSWRIVPIAGTDGNNYFSGIKHDTLSLTDLDADGDLDVVTTEENGGFLGNGLGAIWFENPTRQGL